MKKAIILFLTGTVQGIFFKQFIKEHAEKIGIKHNVEYAIKTR